MTQQARGEMRVRNYRRCFSASVARVQRRSGDFDKLWADAGAGRTEECPESQSLARKLALIELRSIDTELRDALRWLEMLQQEIGFGG